MGQFLKKPPASPQGAWGALGLLACGAALLLFPGQTREAAAQSALYCLSSLVPSLFPFLVLASYGARSRAGEALGRLVGPAARWGFRLPASSGAVLLLSFVGGYPAGARGISLLWEQGKLTREQAGRMMAFCVAPGPAFVVTFVGSGLLGSLRLGWLLLGAVTLSGLALGVLAGLSAPPPSPSAPAAALAPGGAPLAQAVGDACAATAKMCGSVLLFSAIGAVLQGLGLFQWAQAALARGGFLSQGEAGALLQFLLEVTGATGAAAAQGLSPAFYAFGLAFGGLCVHLQLFAFFREMPLPLGRFFLYRLLHGVLAAGVFLLLQDLFPGPGTPVWAASGVPLAWGATASSAAGGLSLLLMCLAFLLSLSRGSCGPGEDVL